MEKIASENYFQSFNETDIKLRKCSNCQQEYVNSLRKLSKYEAILLSKKQREIKKLTQKYKRLHQIPLEVLICSTDLEGNLPHTHQTFVVLSNLGKTSIKTLIHEKIHIYQRLYPIETNILILKFWDMKINRIHTITDNTRSNPDINKIVYKTRDNESIQATYLDYPTTLFDIKDKRDHPFEIMAYKLSNIIMGEEVDDFTQIWMNKYL